MKWLSICFAVMLTACTSSPESDPTYVSPTQYQNYNCGQISAEMNRISAKIEQASQADNENQVLGAAVTAFAIYRGYSFNNNENIALKRLHNQYDILEQTSIQKECGALSH